MNGRVGYTGVGQRKTGVPLSGALEQVQSFLQRFIVTLPGSDQALPLEIKLVSTDVGREMGSTLGAFFIGKLQIEGRHQLVIKMVLQCEQILFDTPELFTPK